MSWSRLSMENLFSSCGADQATVTRRRSRRKRFDQPLDRTQIMYRAEFVNVRQHHFDALRLGLEAAIAQQRIEPDQAAARSMQPVHLERQPRVCLALQAVGNQKHEGALAQHPPAP